MIITCIAYRENAVDTCRGCYMGSQDSDLQVISSNDPQAIEDFVADLCVEELDNLGSYSFSYLIDGRPVDDGGVYIRSRLGEGYDAELYERYEAVICGIKSDVETRMAVYKSEIKAKKEAAERKKRDDAERQRKQNEIAQLKRLQALYPEV